MKLCDSVGAASVDLFFRTISLRIPGERASGGLAGRFFHPDYLLPEDELATILHEFEHIAGLNHVVGPMFRALALRAVDLRNDYARKALNWRKAQCDCAGLILACGLAHEFSQLVQISAELFRPLFEGLAVMTEFEESGFHADPIPATWRLLVHMELMYIEHMKPGLVPSGDAEGRAETIAELASCLWSQLENARELKRTGDLSDALFWSTSDESAAVPISYFDGYVFLHRLQQTWLERNAVMDSSDFVRVARRLCYEVLPLTLLPLFAMGASPGRARSSELPNTFMTLLDSVQSFSALDVEKLRSQPGLLSFSRDLTGLARYDLGGVASSAGVAHDSATASFAEIFTALAVTIFEAGDASGASSPKETLEALVALDAATRLSPIAQFDALVVGVDTAAKSLVLVDLSQAKGTREGDSLQIAGRPGTKFLFPLDAKGFEYLEAALGDEWKHLPRLDFNASSSRVSVARGVFVVKMATLWEFWPHGIDETFELEEIRPLRWFVHANKLFVSPANEHSRKLLMHRALASRLDKGLRLALDPNGREVRGVLQDIRDLAIEDRDLLLARSVLENMNVNSYADLRDICMQAYEALLFPNVTPDSLERIRRLRFAAIEEHLGRDTSRALRRWLRSGLVLSSSGARLSDGETTNATASHVAAIRRVSEQILGIPLVKFDERARLLALDLVPTNQ